MANETSQPPTAGAKPNSENGFVNKLATAIVAVSGGVLVILIFMAWANLPTCPTCGKEGFTSTKELLSVLLPLIGTWMGTILAFYFSKENFEAANKSVNELVDKFQGPAEILGALSVNDVMIKLDHSTLLTFKTDDDFKAAKLSDLLNKMEETHSERMPILQKDTLKFIFLIYRTTIERFILEVTNKKVTPNRGIVEAQDLTVLDMFESNFQVIKDIVALNFKDYFLPITATLDQVRKAMQDNTICQDVFITKTGQKDEAVEGWITNNMVVEKAELFKKAGSKF